MGTLQNRIESIFRTLAEALSRDDGTRIAADIIESTLEAHAAPGISLQPPAPSALRIAA